MKPINSFSAFLAVMCLCFCAEIWAQAPDGYYSDVLTDSPDALRSSLHDAIDDHQRFPYTSSQTDTWDVLEMADEDPANDRRILTLYRNSSHAKRGGGNEQYNREHTWPRSYGFPNNSGIALNYPFTDMHHLFLADPDFNSARSNKPFEDCAADCSEWPTEEQGGRGGQGGPYPGDSNWTDGEFTQGRWEIWDARKGDIARAMFYMDVRYAGGTHGDTGATEPDLRLTNDRALIDASRTDENEPIAYMGLLDTLLQWHVLDPVDETEMRHHEAVAAFQGNRNPFIDHPEWVSCVYNAQCGFAINAGLNDAWYQPQTAGQGFFVTVFPDIGQLFLAHFTYDAERPPEDVTANIGESGHRWVTAIGPYSNNSATLTATLTRGGLFDDPTEVVSETPYGEYTLEFSDCSTAVLTYDFPQSNLSGRIELERIVNDNIPLCEALSAR